MPSPMSTAIPNNLSQHLVLAIAASFLASWTPQCEGATKPETAEKPRTSAKSQRGGQAATATSTNSRTGEAADELAKAEVVESPIPHSVFELPKSADDGRDPFFPTSTRLFGNVITTKTNTAPIGSGLVLKALAGSPGNRFATINSIVFAEGEERECVTPGGRITVRCLEISEDTVVIEVGGVRRTLRMRQGP